MFPSSSAFSTYSGFWIENSECDCYYHCQRYGFRLSITILDIFPLLFPRPNQSDQQPPTPSLLPPRGHDRTPKSSTTASLIIIITFNTHRSLILLRPAYRPTTIPRCLCNQPVNPPRSSLK
jgi:hypothetical protein